MKRLIAARTPDAQFFTNKYDDNKKLRPFDEWLQENKDTIKFRMKNFLFYYYINNKNFIKFDYLNVAIKGKAKQRFFQKMVNYIFDNDQRLLDKSKSVKSINLPKEYMNDPAVDKSNLVCNAY